MICPVCIRPSEALENSSQESNLFGHPESSHIVKIVDYIRQPPDRPFWLEALMERS